MRIEDVLAILETVLSPRDLSPVQELVLRQVWDKKTYAQIAQQAGYNSDYIKSVGSQLWHLLSDVLEEPVTKRNFCATMKRRFARCNNIDHFEPKQIFQYRDWGETLDTSNFFGRKSELGELEQWIARDRCRLVSILGLGGAGKTSLAMRCAEQMQDEFDIVIWRSLRNPPPIEQLLKDWLTVFSQGQIAQFPTEIDNLIACTMSYLRQHRCLLVLDNWQSILRAGNRSQDVRATCTGRYCRGYEGYGQLLRAIAEQRHQSCLLLTSREKFIGLAAKEGDNLPLRSLSLKGLGLTEVRQIFRAKGLPAPELACHQLMRCYSGNPLALKIAATAIQELFDGNLEQFLAQNILIFGEIGDLLNQQIERLSLLEFQAICSLSLDRPHGCSLSQLQQRLPVPVSLPQLLEALKALQGRSLANIRKGKFVLPRLVSEYFRSLQHSALDRERSAVGF